MKFIVGLLYGVGCLLALFAIGIPAGILVVFVIPPVALTLALPCGLYGMVGSRRRPVEFFGPGILGRTLFRQSDRSDKAAFGLDPAWPSFALAQVGPVGKNILAAGEQWARALSAWTKRPGKPVWFWFWSVLSPIVVAALLAALFLRIGVRVVFVVVWAAQLVLLLGAALTVVVLRAADRSVRVLRGGQASCPQPSCYYVSDIPSFACPSCGVLHHDVRPGPLGVLARRCRCGQLLPTTVTLASRRLRALCANCGEPLSVGAASMKEIRIPVFGSVASGKSRFLWMAVESLAVEARANRAAVTPVGEEAERWETMVDQVIRPQKQTLRTQPGSAVTGAVFQVAQPKGAPFRLQLFDAPGESFQNAQDNAELAFLDRAHGMVLIIDPFTIPRFRDELSQRFPELVSEAVPAELSPEESYDVTEQRLLTYGVNLQKKRLAIVMVKMDLFMRSGMAPARWGWGAGTEIRSWLVGDADLYNLVRRAEIAFGDVAYFATSSFDLPVAGDPRRTSLPLEWLADSFGARLVTAGPGPGSTDTTTRRRSPLVAAASHRGDGHE